MNNPTPAEKERMRVSTRYLIFFIALFHALKVWKLLADGCAPHVKEDWGFLLLCAGMILVNIHLYDESRIYRYCFWHRQPVYFSIYYEASRILLNLQIIKWDTETWNNVDYYVLNGCVLIWIIGYLIHIIYAKLKTKDTSQSSEQSV